MLHAVNVSQSAGEIDKYIDIETRALLETYSRPEELYTTLERLYSQHNMGSPHYKRNVNRAVIVHKVLCQVQERKKRMANNLEIISQLSFEIKNAISADQCTAETIYKFINSYNFNVCELDRAYLPGILLPLTRIMAIYENLEN